MVIFSTNVEKKSSNVYSIIVTSASFYIYNPASVNKFDIIKRIKIWDIRDISLDKSNFEYEVFLELWDNTRICVSNYELGENTGKLLYSFFEKIKKSCFITESTIFKIPYRDIRLCNYNIAFSKTWWIDAENTLSSKDIEDASSSMDTANNVKQELKETISLLKCANKSLNTPFFLKIKPHLASLISEVPEKENSIIEYYSLNASNKYKKNFNEEWPILSISSSSPYPYFDNWKLLITNKSSYVTDNIEDPKKIFNLENISAGFINDHKNTEAKDAPIRDFAFIPNEAEHPYPIFRLDDVTEKEAKDTIISIIHCIKSDLSNFDNFIISNTNYSSEQIFCVHCGKSIIKTVNFCNFCGEKNNYKFLP